MNKGIAMAENRETRENLAPLISLLKDVIERQIRAIQHGTLLLAAQRHCSSIVIDAPCGVCPPAGALPVQPVRRFPNPANTPPHSLPVIPRHVTFEVNVAGASKGSGPVGRLECRQNGKVTWFLFRSRTGANLVLQTLARRGAITAIEEQVLATRILLSSLPDRTEGEIEWRTAVKERDVGMAIPLERHLSDGFERSEAIIEAQEWVM
jgi:hypothetical protein